MNKTLLTLLVLLLGVGPVAAGDLSPGDFAYGYPLKTDSMGAISALVVPDEVYRTARRADLGDIRVFNAAGEVVPHLLRQAAMQDVGLPSREDVPFFPLPQAAGQGAGPELAVMVQRNVHGTIIHIDSQQSVPGTGQPVSAYLFDLSGLKIEARDLELIWPTGGLAVATVDLQESSDLVQWRPLVESATLVDLQHQGQRIAQRTLHLPAQPLKYVKMSDRTGQGLFALQKVTALSGIEPAGQQRHWLAVDKGKVGQADTLTAIDFNSSYRLPVSGARLLFPEPNSMLRATVQSRPDDTSPWRSRCSGVFYALQVEGARIDSEPCAFPETADPQWRLAVSQDGAGLEKPQRVPSLELGWTPAELLFVSRGPAPYTLAFGSGRLEYDAGVPGSDMILPAISTEEGRKLIRSASLGSRIELGGKAALQAPSPPLPWKKGLLWLVLLTGVGLLAYMVRHLLREMGRSD